MFQVACLLLIYPGGALMGVCLYPLPRSTRYDKSVIIYTIYAPYKRRDLGLQRRAVENFRSACEDWALQRLNEKDTRKRGNREANFLQYNDIALNLLE